MPSREDASITLFHAPRTRSFTALWLLEELGLDYRLDSFDLGSGRHKQPDYLAMNPMGKVPVVVDDGIPVSELGAIAIYLSDKYRRVPLAPEPDSPQRPAFLRWIFFSSAIIEPALGEKFFKWEVPSSSVAWGSFEQMFSVLTNGVGTADTKSGDSGPWLLGEQFTAADVLVGSSSRFGLLFGAFPKEGPVADYVARISLRPAFERAQAIESELAQRLAPG